MSCSSKPGVAAFLASFTKICGSSLGSATMYSCPFPHSAMLRRSSWSADAPTATDDTVIRASTIFLTSASY
jgi:hypothetical protein